MNRILLFVILFFSAAGTASAQTFMNEWIDVNKTYHRFRIGASGVYRITQSQLASLGLAGTDAAHFQLWRNGEEVALFTSVSSGIIPSNGFIEFWGDRNDGKWEKRMYLQPQFQINEGVSLFTDSATYFLTVNASAPNKRFSNIGNGLPTALTPEPFFMHKLGMNYANAYSPGFAAVVGEFVYSSSYDEGEGYVSTQIGPATNFTANNSNLFVASTGPNASLRYSAAGRSLNLRSIQVWLNGTLLGERPMNYFNAIIDNTSYGTIPLSLLSSNTANFQFRNTSTVSTDRMVMGFYELTYPRQFNFGGQSVFEFELSANASGNYLVINNFNHGGVQPVLYDLTNNLRITTDISVPGEVRVVLPPSTTTRRLVLAGHQSGQIRSGSGFIVRNYINLANVSQQGDYLIISNPRIYNDAGGINQVEAYRAYRSSASGGGFTARIYDIDVLIDQFGWGIRNNGYAIRNFLRYARSVFAQQPQYCFIIGKGVAPHTTRSNDAVPAMQRLNLVPTFGVPASDMLLGADEGSIVPKTPIGRLNIVSAEEVLEYLNKVKVHEQNQRVKSCRIEDEIWKKDVLHIGGANDFLGEQIIYYLNQYKGVVSDSCFGANVYTLQKSSVASVQTLSGDLVTKLFTNGFGLMTYFGHSSANTLEFNLDNPENYPISNKYPIFLINGCNAGNLFLFDSMRFRGNFTLSEKYLVGASQRGAVAFIASTHLGIVNYLHLYTEEYYNQISKVNCGASIGRVMKNISDSLVRKYTINDFFVRMHVEQQTLHGDPALQFFYADKPDYAIEPQFVRVAPEFISIAENKFRVNVKFFNIGAVRNDSLRVQIKRQLPDGSSQMLFNQKFKGIRHSDSVQLDIPINPVTDKGSNQIIVSLDPENQNEELCETNNVVSKEFFIFEDEIRPVYPFNYSIVGQQNITFAASTANPLSVSQKIYFEIDTTLKFNSNVLRRDSIVSSGGSISFRPTALTLINDRVYYWRVGIRLSGVNTIIWNNSSFIYRTDLGNGFNQSHYGQYSNNTFQDLELDSVTRTVGFRSVVRKLGIKTGLFPFYNSQFNNVSLDLERVDLWRCNWNVFSIYVFDPKNLKWWLNRAEGGGGRFGSLWPMCLGYERGFFEFSMESPTQRNSARLFLENIVPDSALVLIINQGTFPGSWAGPNTAFIQHWMADTAIYGTGNSIYHTMLRNGLTDIDKFTRNLPFAFLYQKKNLGYVRQFIGENEGDFIDVIVDIPAKLPIGTVETPWMGPSKEWKNFMWDGFFPGGMNTRDSLVFHLYGRTPAGAEQLVGVVKEAKDTSIAHINAAQFPFVKMKMLVSDPEDLSPFQLQYWRLAGTYLPEGAIAPNMRFTFKDTLELGEPLQFSIAFKNVSEKAFDSLKLKLILTDQNNVPTEITLPRKKALIAGDTLVVSHTIDTRNLPGKNALYLMVNPDNDQPEQLLFNNFVFKDFFVKPDQYKPWLDVTFDGVHILNRDIVSARPHILIQLKDDSRFLALDDTSGLRVRVRYPDRTIQEFRLGTDSARFTPANINAGNNTAVIDLYPHFRDDGEYELLVSGTDKSGNRAGNLDYTVAFQVINKPMISNLFNYPNPFTSSTAFVFTLTGAEVPQNIRIQILTITGKVVREITKQELGPIRIGRNITEFKWDGTDQYGNKLANGIYLYRVLTNLNGRSLEKFQDVSSGTDSYFNRGYGKMYLMR